MKRRDLAALSWLDVTIRRAGSRTTARYLRYFQHEQLVDPVAADVLPRPPDEGDPESVLDIRQALGRLPRAERRVLLLCAVADLPQRRVAAILHLSQARVSQLRRQALTHLRALLGEGGDSDV